MKKSEQLQIRVTPWEKAVLRERAEAYGVDLSTYVLSQALSDESVRYSEILGSLSEEDTSFGLAELNDLLADLEPERISAVAAVPPPGDLPPHVRAYVAAMVELAAARGGVAPPGWTRDIGPLPLPRFGAPLKSVRPHLLKSSPVPFKRRNIFIDSSVGDRV